jgi:hypothetical protein
LDLWLQSERTKSGDQVLAHSSVLGAAARMGALRDCAQVFHRALG